VVQTGVSHSTTSSKSRSRPKKDPAAKKEQPVSKKNLSKSLSKSLNKSLSKSTQKSRASHKHAGLGNLTVKRVTNVIAQLDNVRGSTLESIKSKLNRCGLDANTSHVRNALERAVKSGLIKEIREERFTLPSGAAKLGKDRPSTSNLSTSSSIRTKCLKQHPTARVVATAAQCRRPRKALQACDPKRRQQRRPPQGRRPMMDGADGGSYSDDSGRNDDRRAGDGHDIDDDQIDDDVERKESIGNSLSEPVAGCDAVMVFGTH
jgi:hypothetical protein